MEGEVDTDSHSTAASPPEPGPCWSAARLYIYCKREQLDARSRMRGNKALR